MRKTFTDNYYHVFLRGVDRNKTFLDEIDYLRFMSLINVCNQPDSKKLSTLLQKKDLFKLSQNKNLRNNYVKILSFVLMPNHFHLLIREKKEYNLAKLMQRVLSSYTLYFNNKYKRKGHLFESKYNFKLISSDVYLKNLQDYILNNPVKIINKKYKHINLLNGEIKLNSKEIKYIEEYPYYYTSNVK